MFKFIILLVDDIIVYHYIYDLIIIFYVEFNIYVQMQLA